MLGLDSRKVRDAARHRWWIAGAVLALVVLILLLWAVLAQGGPLSRDRTWERIHAEGVLRVGLDASFPPFEMIDPETSEIYGFDVDLAGALAAELGVRAEFLNIGFDSLYDQLLAGRFDAVISALPVDYTWTEDVRYSEPYFQAGLVLVTTRALASTIQRPEDLVGRRAAVEWGSEGDAFIRQLEREQGQVEVLAVGSPAEALGTVRAGEADACLVDAVSAYQGWDGTLSAPRQTALIPKPRQSNTHPTRFRIAANSVINCPIDMDKKFLSFVPEQ
ncbi:MAG: substrate-binding periplasmic protein [Anaerolineae bacterium]